MSRDGKNKFYRTLKFDKKTWEILKEFNKLKIDMINEIENEEENEQ